MDLYARPDLGRSILAIATSVVPFIGLWALMYLALDVSYLLVLALAVPAAGFLLRTYIHFHDCAHGLFLPGRRANSYVGAVLALHRGHPAHSVAAGWLTTADFFNLLVDDGGMAF